MGRVGNFKVGVQLHQGRIHPVALMIERGLAVGESGQLAVLGAVEQHILGAILEQQGHVLAILMEAFFVHFAFQHLVDVGGVVALVANGQVDVEVMQTGDPGHAGGGAGHHGNDHVQTQFFLHGIQLFKGGLEGVEVGEGRGVDAGLVQDVLVVSQAIAFHGHGEADHLVAVHVSGGGVLGPFRAGLVSDLVFPQFVARGAFDDPDVGFAAGLHFSLQHGVVVGGAATGDDLHVNAGLFGVQLGVILHRGSDFHLVLADHDVGQSTGGGQHHGQSENQSENLLHNGFSFMKCIYSHAEFHPRKNHEKKVLLFRLNPSTCSQLL